MIEREEGKEKRRGERVGRTKWTEEKENSRKKRCKRGRKQRISR